MNLSSYGGEIFFGSIKVCSSISEMLQNASWEIATSVKRESGPKEREDGRRLQRMSGDAFSARAGLAPRVSLVTIKSTLTEVQYPKIFACGAL